MPISHDALLERQLENPEFREYWERTALARAIANRVIGYRAQHGLSQSALARRIGVSQPVVARLESGEHDPRVATLMKLSGTLGLRFDIDIHPTSMSSIRSTAVDVGSSDAVSERVVRDQVELLILAD